MPAAISSYNFYLYEGETENTSLLDVAKEADPDTPGQQTVIMEELDPEIDSVVIEYLNADGKVAGLTEVPVELTAGQETVLDDFECFTASEMFIIGSADYIAPGEEVSFVSTVVYGDDEDEAIEREIANEDIEYSAENEVDPNLRVRTEEEGGAVLEPKEGENGVFTGKTNGKAIVRAVYFDGMEAEASVAVTDAELTGVVIADYVPLVPESELYLLYAENALPDSFTERTDGVELPGVQGKVRNEEEGDAEAPPSGYHPSAIIGANKGKICLVGIMSDDTMIRLTADEWASEGDFLSYEARGQQVVLTASSAGEGGKISASYAGKSSDDPTEAGEEAMTAEVTVTALEAAASLAIYWNGWDASGEEGVLTLNREPTIGEWQMIACGYYEFKVPENNEQMERYGLFAPKSNDEVDWSLTSTSEYVTINGMGLLAVGEQIQVGDEATITYNVEGCDLDMPSVSGKIVD